MGSTAEVSGSRSKSASQGTASPAAAPGVNAPRTPLRDAVAARRSHSKVTDEAPSSRELGEILQAMTALADHSGLRPWRIIEIRGKARKKLGKAFAKAAAKEKDSTGKPVDTDKHIAKSQRSPLVLAIVVSPRNSSKVPYWEQEAVASGVAHTLELLLEEAGWGSIWRTGSLTRTKPLRKAHQLAKGEELLGWLYVGGIPDRDRKAKRRKPLDLTRHLSSM